MSYHLLRDLRSLSLCNFDPIAASDASQFKAKPTMGHQLFFTLQSIQNDLLYVSEVAIAYTGLDFGVISLPDLGPRLYKAKVSMYMKPLHSDKWVLFYRLKVDVRNLVDVGKLDDRDDDATFVPNTILWRFNDVYFCLRPDLLDYSVLDRARALSWSRPRALKRSYTLDDIRQLSSLHIGITEFAESKGKLSVQIEQQFLTLQKIPDSNSSEKTRYLKFDLHTLHKFIVKQNGANDALHLEVYKKKLQIGRCKQLIEEEFPQFRDICNEKLEIAESQIEPLQDSLNSSIYPGLITVLQDIGTILQDTFPIESSIETGRFSICGIPFPSKIRELLDFCYYGENDKAEQAEPESNSEALNIEKINSGLAYIVQLMLMLASLMNITLKYQMEMSPAGSFLVDNISPQQLSPTDQKQAVDFHGSIKITFPLFYSADQTQRFASYESPNRNFTMKNPRFEQGLNLLNKNLVTLIGLITDLYSQYYHDNVANHLISNNIPVDCLDNFLWNLQYLLLFMTAPSGKV